jgi:cell division protein FtsQ
LVFVALAGLGSLIAHASADAKFFVYEGRIVGARHSDAVEIYRTAGVHEQSIFWIDPQQVARRVIQLDGIRAVRVRCELPSRVIIEVEEREPAVMWRAGRQQRDWWLDGEGVVLPYHGDVNAPNTVFVVDSSDRELQIGDRIEPEGMAQSVLQLAQAVPGIRVFFYEPDRGLSFTQQVGGAEWPVYVGTSRDLARKIQVMQALTNHLQENEMRPRYVDVRWADHPVYGKAPAGETVGGQ